MSFPALEVCLDLVQLHLGLTTNQPRLDCAVDANFSVVGFCLELGGDGAVEAG